MPNYRRNFVPGGTYFFTVTLKNRNTTLLTDEIAKLKDAVHHVKSRHPFAIIAWVTLPDHLHCLWTLPAHDIAYPTRWRLIKAHFTRATTPKFAPSPWQSRYWEHTIRDEQDLTRHIDYIHFNPVKHNLAPTPAAWPHSTFHHYVARGLYPPTWSPPHRRAE